MGRMRFSLRLPTMVWFLFLLGSHKHTGTGFLMIRSTFVPHHHSVMQYRNLELEGVELEEDGGEDDSGQYYCYPVRPPPLTTPPPLELRLPGLPALQPVPPLCRPPLQPQTLEPCPPDTPPPLELALKLYEQRQQENDSNEKLCETVQQNNSNNSLETVSIPNETQPQPEPQPANNDNTSSRVVVVRDTQTVRAALERFWNMDDTKEEDGRSATDNNDNNKRSSRQWDSILPNPFTGVVSSLRQDQGPQAGVSKSTNEKPSNNSDNNTPKKQPLVNDNKRPTKPLLDAFAARKVPTTTIKPQQSLSEPPQGTSDTKRKKKKSWKAFQEQRSRKPNVVQTLQDSFQKYRAHTIQQNNQNDDPLFSWSIQPNVPPSQIIGATLLACLMTLSSTRDISHVPAAVALSSYVSVTKGDVGDLFRVVGQVLYDSGRLGTVIVWNVYQQATRAAMLVVPTSTTTTKSNTVVDDDTTTTTQSMAQGVQNRSPAVSTPNSQPPSSITDRFRPRARVAATRLERQVTPIDKVSSRQRIECRREMLANRLQRYLLRKAQDMERLRTKCRQTMLAERLVRQQRQAQKQAPQEKRLVTETKSQRLDSLKHNVVDMLEQQRKELQDSIVPKSVVDVEAPTRPDTVPKEKAADESFAMTPNRESKDAARQPPLFFEESSPLSEERQPVGNTILQPMDALENTFETKPPVVDWPPSTPPLELTATVSEGLVPAKTFDPEPTREQLLFEKVRLAEQAELASLKDLIRNNELQKKYDRRSRHLQWATRMVEHPVGLSRLTQRSLVQQIAVHLLAASAPVYVVERW